MSNEIEQKPMEPVAHQRNGLVSLHPAVYYIFMAMALLFVLGAWSFAGTGYAGLAIVMVTLIIAFGIGVVADLGHVWRDHHDWREDPGEPTESFHEWLRRPVTVRSGTLTGRQAAFTAALPILAGGIGMALFAIAHAVVIG